MKRIIWIILDSVGIGQMEDSAKFGDEGADTLGHIYKHHNGEFSLPNMEKLGLGNIDGINDTIKDVENPEGVYCKAREVSQGKDTTIGHWEMTGIITDKPFKTYPDGFPSRVIDEFVKKAGIPGVLGNKVASGTEILKELGKEHMETKKPIVYTSADSVFQIACHEQIYSNEELYGMCQIAREILVDDEAVARVIARPFVGDEQGFLRTSARRDFSLKPNANNVLSKLKDNGIPVYAVGKIEDIFAGVGISEAIHTKDNMDGVDKTIAYMESVEKGLIFTNLVDYDSVYGHRRDVEGYGRALQEFDERLPEIIGHMKDEDVLIINADHGCDPTFKGTDHTREFIPILIYKKNIESCNKGVRDSFSDIGATIAKYFQVEVVEGKPICIFE